MKQSILWKDDVWERIQNAAKKISADTKVEVTETAFVRGAVLDRLAALETTS